MGNSFRRGSAYQKYLLDIMALYRQRKDIRNYLELLLSLVAIGAFVVLAIRPTLTTIGELISKIAVEEETVAALDTKINNLGIAQNLYNTNEESIKLLNSAVPVNPDVASYIRQLEGLAKKWSLTTTNLSTANIDLLSSSDTKVAKSLSTSIIITGDYGNLENFIKEVENLRRPAIIVKMALQTDSSTLNLTLVPEVPYIQ